MHNIKKYFYFTKKGIGNNGFFQYYCIVWLGVVKVIPLDKYNDFPILWGLSITNDKNVYIFVVMSIKIRFKWLI